MENQKNKLHRITLNLDEETYYNLQRFAARRHKKMTAVVRELISGNTEINEIKDQYTIKELASLHNDIISLMTRLGKVDDTVVKIAILGMYESLNDIEKTYAKRNANNR